MEILQKFRENGYFTAELYYLLTKKKIVDPTQEQILPSEYVREMKMTTEERLKHLNNIDIENIVTKQGAPNHAAVLSFTPKLLVFQNFKPNDRIVAKFNIKNISKAPTYLNLDYKESSNFFVKPCGGQLLSRLAPGISITFSVTFMPQQQDDFIHRVTFSTDVDRYILPLIAMGARPIFDFPDQIVLPKIPLKLESSNTVAIHNLGGAPGGFKIACKTPFGSTPYSAYLTPGERLDVKIRFKTIHIGETRQTMIVSLETGENLRVNLIGTSFVVSVELEKTTVRFLDTFNTMSRQQTFKVTNKSPYQLTYMCMKNRCVSHDFDEKFKLAHVLYDFKESESKKYEKLVRYDIVTSEEHERVYTRIFFDELHSLIADQTITYQNMNFEISPIKGILWPNKVTELTITFAPKEIGEFQTTAFLDIDGVSDRMPIKVLGTSLPPAICLNVEHLNMGQVFINKTYHYEVVAMNKGHIEGIVEYKEVPTVFESVIKCSPTIHCLSPGQKDAFVISFLNSNQGPFFEEVNFILRDTEVVLKLYLKGEIIYPSLIFSLPLMDFGNVSIGVPKTIELQIINESEVNGKALLNISSDGPEISSIKLIDYEFAKIPKPQIPEWPREFTIEPRKISFEPMSRIPLKITLIANLVRANQTALELELDHSDSPPILLPIVFNAMVPTITPAPDIIARAWFMEFTYEYDVNITANEIQGYFTVEEPDESNTLQVTVNTKEGHIASNSTITIPVSIRATQLGYQEYTLRILLFGMSKTIDICNIRGTAVRPIVTCSPTTLHFGNSKLLQKYQKQVTLINDSPVTVYYRTSLLHRDGRWQVEPVEDKIDPESESVLVVSLYLVDADTYTNKIIIELENVRDIIVPLIAVGVGTSIVVGPLRDRIDLGRNFIKIPLNKEVEMQNLGTRFHILEWTHHYKMPKTQPITTPFFDINPKMFRMGPGEKLKISVSGICAKATTMKETWFLVGSVESLNKKELLVECEVFAEFVEPKIEQSVTLVEFHYDYGPYGEFYKLTHLISIKNVSTLPLDMDISVKPPFAIIERQGTYKIPLEDENKCTCIYYDTHDINMENLIREIGPEKSKVFIDCLTHKRIDRARTEPLTFFEDIHKIKAAFKLTHTVEEHMEDRDIMIIQIVFDTTKHQSLRSKVYSELLRIKFKGHKNKDSVRLIGKINFPNIMVFTPKIDFKCLLNGAMESKTIKIQNVTPLLACYTFRWKRSLIRKPAQSSISIYGKSVTDNTIGTTLTGPFTYVSYPSFPCPISPPTPCPTPGGDRDTEYTFEHEHSPMVQTSIVDIKFEKQRILKKIAPMINYEHEPLFEWKNKLPIVEKSLDIEANDIFQLMPHRGLLKPREVQYVQIIFKPTPNIIVDSELEIEVLGGPSEIITVTGKSSDLMYKLSTNKLNFKVRSFHQNATENLIISNISAYNFKYKTYSDERKVGTLKGIIVDLSPGEGVLEMFQERQISVVVRPGVLGYFERQFLLEVAHLPHIPITVFGWGVVPQVYLSLKRPGIKDLPIELGYIAIPSLSTEYLEAVNDIFLGNEQGDHANLPVDDEAFEDKNLLDWHVCSSWDAYPTVIDIELAIERVLVTNHIKSHPELMHAYSTAGKTGPIQGFFTTPYVIDFGVVITGCTAQCLADVINYGPIVTKLRFEKLHKVQTWLNIKICGKLNPGETGKLEVLLSPTDQFFPELEQNVETDFVLMVPYGVSIPVQVKAICAVPYLMSNVTLIDFGMVRCGDKVDCTIPLKNVGKPACVWYVTLKIKAPGRNPLKVLNTSGKFEPGESGWLTISFKPTMEIMYEGMLIFRFHMNPNQMTIPIMGQGVIPHVQIIGPNVTFPATLPWSRTTEMYFGITNPCPFPVEIIFPHSDQKWKDEEELWQLLYNYYNKPEEMLVPLVRPGAGLPSEINSFFSWYQESVRKALQEEIALSTKQVTTLKTSGSKQGPAIPGSGRKELKRKSPKGNIMTSKKLTDTGTPTRAYKTEADIIAEEIKKMKDKNLDPLQECLKDFDKLTLPEDKKNRGVIIAVHGSPGEGSQGLQIAYALGKRLNIPSINIDTCIVEALLTSTSAAQSKIMSAIEELHAIFNKNLNKDSQLILEEEGREGSLEQLAIIDTRDEHEILWNKLVDISHSKAIGTPRSKLKDTSKKKKSPSTTSLGDHSALAAIGSTTMFQLDLLEELLVEYFELPKFDLGFVVDTLTSLIFKEPTTTLTNVLRYKSGIWNVHLIMCHSEFSKWAKDYEEIQKALEPEVPEPKVYTETEIQEIVNSVEDMEEHEYDSLDPELKSIYINNGLQERRKKYLEKKGLWVEEQEFVVPVKKGKSVRETKSLATDGTGDEGVKKKKSEKDSKREAKSPVSKPAPEYLAMVAKYNDYSKVTYDSLISIANNWVFEEAEVGIPLLGHNGDIISGNGPQKKAKGKKSEVQLSQTLPDVPYPNRGFPIVIVVGPSLRFKDSIVEMFARTPLVVEALRTEEQEDILLAPIDRKEYTVLLPKTFPQLISAEPLKWNFLNEEPIKKCECNPITDFNLMDDSNQDNVFNVLSKWHCVCGKKVLSSQTSTTEPFFTTASMRSMQVGSKQKNLEFDYEQDKEPLPLHSVQTTIFQENRLVLQPGDLVRCKYTFNPQCEGHFIEKRYVEVFGWPDSRAVINVNAISDLPRLDSRPKKMFANFIRKTIEGQTYKLAYLDDQKCFEFGPIFVGSQRVYQEDYPFDLRNSSLMPANISIEFLEEQRVFQVDKRELCLEPGERGIVTLTAAPDEVGVHRTELILGVRDNPEVIAIPVSCKGVLAHVEILPHSKIIEFGKHLLYRREDERFIVKNDSVLPIMWKIRNPEDFVADFIISKTSGIVQQNDNEVVLVTYIACNVGIISERQLLIYIFDEHGRGNPLIMDALNLTAECYDVKVDCAYEDPANNFLDYGNVKVNSTVTREMYLLNRGKYNIYFKLKKVKNFPEPSLLRSFELTQEQGVIPPSMKLVSLEFTCTPTTSTNLINTPAYTCSLLDGSKNQVVVAKFPVCISIASFYNTFTLFPLGELNFNIIPIGTGVIRDVIINNTSKCPFTYEIVVPEKYQVEKEMITPTKHKKGLVNPPIYCGNFVIMVEDYLVAPGTSRTIPIQFNANKAATFKETINFIVSDTCPAESQGVPLHLVGTGAVPTLDFWNIETTFREHLIVRSLSDYKVPEPSPHAVFAEDTVTLHFFSVIINTSFTAIIDLYNNGLVASALTMRIHQTNADQGLFSLDKSSTHIEPLLHKTMGVTFSPKALKEYRAVLEINLKLYNNQEKSYKICLIGEGVIPRIKLVTPKMKLNRTGLLRFPVTCLGSITSKNITFSNISSTRSYVEVYLNQNFHEDKPEFWMVADSNTESKMLLGNNEFLNTTIQIVLSPAESATLIVNFNPANKGKTHCDITLTIKDNPFEYFSISCEAEAFSEEVVLLDLEMLPMDIDMEVYKLGGVPSVPSRVGSTLTKKTRRRSERYSKTDTTVSDTPSVLRYLLDFGGCEIGKMQKRSVVMVNNSEKVYKFDWGEVDYVVVKPSLGYIAPGEEKDLEIMFYSTQLVNLDKETLPCALTAISDDTTIIDLKGGTWDNRQTVTSFEHNPEVSVNERIQIITNEVDYPASNILNIINIEVIYSAVTEYTKYQCNLQDELDIQDTFIYQTRTFEFTVQNTGLVPMKIRWDFELDEEFPTRNDKLQPREKEIMEMSLNGEEPSSSGGNNNTNTTKTTPPDTQDKLKEEESRVTLFSGNLDRDSVDTWFEIDLPFKIEPVKECLNPKEKRVFTITFSPREAFLYKVKLKSIIDNLDPYDENAFCKITARSLIPYCHLDIEESDYISSGRRKVVGVALPPQLTILEFNVLGSGCYKKTFNVINPTSEAYEFNFEMMISDHSELIPFHCDMLKGFVEGGTSTEVTFTFTPSSPGVYESLWKFIIPCHKLLINVLVVGISREPEVNFVPTILIIKNSLVGFTTTHSVLLKNGESEPLIFEFKGNSLYNDSGKNPVVVDPEQGIIKARSETPVNIIYTPDHDGPLSFKIFCTVSEKELILCVNALSYSINPTVTYKIIGNEHLLKSDVVTHIHLEQTASTYERLIPFTIKNDGSATFFFDWHYNPHNVKKYLQIHVEPRSGHLTPGQQANCILHFNLKQVPVHAFPVTLTISDGPEYSIMLFANIAKPSYHFTCKTIEFGKCIVNAPDETYKKYILLHNDDKNDIIVDLNFTNVPDLLVDFPETTEIAPQKKSKIKVFFRPKQIKEYEFKVQFWVNSLCEEIITIKGEGVPLLFDLYEGCQKTFNLGPVKIGEKVVRQIEVMNYSKVPIDATLIFTDGYQKKEVDDAGSEATSICLNPSVFQPSAQEGTSRVKMLKAHRDSKARDQIDQDIKNSLLALKVIPSKCVIQPFRKLPLKIQFKPTTLISKLDAQLNMRVLNVERPLVKLSGAATGMNLCLSQTSLQFGTLRKRGLKTLKVMLLNKGDFGARFCWQPLRSNEFTISPMQGHIDPHSNVTFTITCRPILHNPFIKVWASCNIENYVPLELALYAACLDVGTVSTQTIFMECPVREVVTDHLVVTNPTDDLWTVLSELTGEYFETLKEFRIEPNSTFEIPISFKPKIIGSQQCQILFSPFGDGALFVNVFGTAEHPNPNSSIQITTRAKEPQTHELIVYNITERPESYVVSTEIVRTVPDKFTGYYEMKHPHNIKVWGEASATCRWTFVCYEECEMYLKVLFVNEETHEYQFYNIMAVVTSSKIVDTLNFESLARESVQKEIMVTNPLATDAVFTVKCASLAVPETLHIHRNSEAALVMTYAPLVVGTNEDFLEVSNDLVGTYLYKVILTCTPGKEKEIEVSTAFGTRKPIRLRVHNKTDVGTEFECTVDHNSIIANKEYPLHALERGKFLVYFEPTQLRQQNSRVSFVSPTAGEFVFNIKGYSLMPKPQGPYEIRPGGFATVIFKNVYDNEKVFTIQTDREEFTIKRTQETVKSKEVVQIVVYLVDAKYDTNPAGSLTVAAPADEDGQAVTWTYFLQGNQ